MVPEKKKKIQKELRMFLCLTLASAVIGFNIKSFVKTGGLFQRPDHSDTAGCKPVFRNRNSVFGHLSPDESDTGIYRFQIHQQEIHHLFLLCGFSLQYTDRCVSGSDHNI